MDSSSHPKWRSLTRGVKEKGDFVFDIRSISLSWIPEWPGIQRKLMRKCSRNALVKLLREPKRIFNR